MKFNTPVRFPTPWHSVEPLAWLAYADALEEEGLEGVHLARDVAAVLEECPVHEDILVFDYFAANVIHRTDHGPPMRHSVQYVPIHRYANLRNLFAISSKMGDLSMWGLQHAIPSRRYEPNPAGDIVHLYSGALLPSLKLYNPRWLGVNTLCAALRRGKALCDDLRTSVPRRNILRQEACELVTDPSQHPWLTAPDSKFVHVAAAWFARRVDYYRNRVRSKPHHF